MCSLLQEMPPEEHINPNQILMTRLHMLPVNILGESYISSQDILDKPIILFLLLIIVLCMTLLEEDKLVGRARVK